MPPKKLVVKKLRPKSRPPTPEAPGSDGGSTRPPKRTFKAPGSATKSTSRKSKPRVTYDESKDLLGEIEAGFLATPAVSVDAVHLPQARPAAEKITVNHILQALEVSFDLVQVPETPQSIEKSKSWEEIRSLIVEGIEANEEVEISFGTFFVGSDVNGVVFTPGVSAQIYEEILRYVEGLGGATKTVDVVEIDNNSEYRRITTEDEVTYQLKRRYRDRTINVLDGPYRVSFSLEEEGLDQATIENFSPKLIRRRYRTSAQNKLFTIDVSRVIQEDLATNTRVLRHEVELEFKSKPVKTLPKTLGTFQTFIFGGGMPYTYAEKAKTVELYAKLVGSKSPKPGGMSTAWMSKPISLTPRELSQSWAVTNKLDGQRRVVIVCDTGVWVHSDPDLFKLSPTSLKITAVLDCEYYEDKYYVFDAVWYQISSLEGTGDITKADLSVRLDKAQRAVARLNTVLPDKFQMKVFYHPSDVIREQDALGVKHNPVYGCVQKADDEQARTSAVVEYDGFIFQSTGKYTTNSARKWKPADKMTIDFYLDHGDEENKYILHTWNKYRKANLPWDSKYLDDQEIPGVVVYQPGSDGLVVECQLEDGKWVVLRERPDKLYPNATDVAESVWLNIVRPIEKTTILGKDLILMRAYHNKIKAGLINSTVGGGNPEVVDFGSGQGGDIDKWVSAGIRKIWCVEPSSDMREMFEDRMSRKKKSVDSLRRQAERLKGRGDYTSRAINGALAKLRANEELVETTIKKLSKGNASRVIELRRMLGSSTAKAPEELKKLLDTRRILQLELKRVELAATKVSQVYGSKYYEMKDPPEAVRAAEMMSTASRIENLSYELLDIGADDESLAERIGEAPQVRKGRVVFAFFSLTFMAEAERMRALVANIDAILHVPGAVFVGMVLDGTKLKNLVGDDGLVTEAFSIVPTGNETPSTYSTQVFDAEGNFEGDHRVTAKYPEVTTNINDPTSKVKDVTEWAFCFESFADAMAAVSFKLMKTGFLDSGPDFEALGPDAKIWSSMTRFFVFKRFTAKELPRQIIYPETGQYRLYDGPILGTKVPNLYLYGGQGDVGRVESGTLRLGPSPGLSSFFAVYLYCSDYGFGDLTHGEQIKKADKLRLELAESLDPTLIDTLADPQKTYRNLKIPLDPTQVCEYVSVRYGYTTIVISSTGKTSIYGQDLSKLMVVSYADGRYYPMVLFGRRDEEGEPNPDLPYGTFTRTSPGFAGVFDDLE